MVAARWIAVSGAAAALLGVTSVDVVKPAKPVHWPASMRIQGNSVIRFAIPQDVSWARPHVPQDMSAYLEVAAEGAHGTLRLDPVNGTAIPGAGTPRDLVLTLRAGMNWRDEDVVTAHRVLAFEIKRLDGARETKEIKLSVVPATDAEIALIGAEFGNNQIAIRVQVQDFFEGEIDDNGQLAVWAQPAASAAQESFQGVRVGPRTWRIALPQSTVGQDLSVRFQQGGWTDVAMTVHVNGAGHGKPIAERVASELDRRPYIDVPDYKRWIRIGPHYPPGFVANTVDNHDTVAVYARPQDIEAAKRAGDYPLGMLLVKESRPVISSAAPRDKRETEQLIEFSKYAGGAARWIYTGTLRKETVRQGTRMYAFQSPTCFNCHHKGGVNNVFVTRYPILQAAVHANGKRIGAGAER